MSEETRQALIKICDLIKRVCQEAAVDGNPIDDRWKLGEIHEDAQRMIDEDLRR